MNGIVKNAGVAARRALGVRYAHRSAFQVPNINLTRGAGLPGLFTAKGLEVAWFDGQARLLAKINDALDKDEKLASLPSANAAQLRSAFVDEALASGRADIAGLAAQAITNELFFQMLKPEGSSNPRAVFEVDNGLTYNQQCSSEVDVSGEVLNAPPRAAPTEQKAPPSTDDRHYPSHERLTASFGSVSAFRELLIERGDAQLGDGAVWLVKGDDCWLVNTYGCQMPPFVPVMCVSLWPAVYLHDYGVFGKRAFLKNAFDCINWNFVDERLERVSASTRAHLQRGLM